MSRQRHVAILLLSVGFALLGSGHALHAQPAIAYRVVDLGTFADGTYSAASAVNNRGEVVGRADHYDPATGIHFEHAFFWKDRNGNGVSDPGEMIDLGTLGGRTSQATGINDAGVVVGTSDVVLPDASTASHVFRWRDANQNGLADPGEMEDLGPSTAYGIGNAGDIAAFNNYNACDSVFSGGVWIGVQGCGADFFDTSRRRAGNNPVNGLGQMVGGRSTGGTYSPYVFDVRTGTISLLSPVLGINASAQGINDVGQVIGYGGGGTGGAIWTGGQVIELGPHCNFTEATHINNLGQVVGVCYDGFGSHAFFWQDSNGNGVSDPGEMVDLRTLIPSGAIAAGLSALAINDAQQIVGSGYFPNAITNGFHAVMLTPSSVIITTDALPDGSVGDGYSAALAASYGTTPYAWSLAPASPPLPAGLTLDGATGLILGTPSQAGTFPLIVQVTDGGSAVATRALSLRIFPFTLSAYGTATPDGVLSPGEWDHAACKEFAVNLPGGPITPARLCAMNDALNLHVALSFYHGGVFDGNTFALEFDNNNDGVAENGDDAYLVNPQVGFIDDFRTNKAPFCPAGSAAADCAPGDVDDGGTTDGAGAFTDTNGFTVYEMSHPLNSGDTGHDFALHSGDAVGFWAFVRALSGADYADTYFPGFRNYARIIVADGALVTPAGRNVVVRPSDSTTGEARVTVSFDEVTQSGTTGVYTLPNPPPMPTNFSLDGVAFEIFTTGSFTEATVCISYAGLAVPQPPTLYHVVGGVPVDITIRPVDEVNKVICGRVTSFSPFMVGTIAPRRNSRPTAMPANVTVDEDSSIAITLMGADADGDPLTFSIVNHPVHGTLSGTAPNLTYTPAPNFSGTDRFTFRAFDGALFSHPATVRITVKAKPLGVTVVGPNGGETLFKGLSTTIAWTASGSPAAFDVAISRNGGATFANVPGCVGLPATARSCHWSVHGPGTSSALVRVTARRGHDRVHDTSDAVFTIIVPTITVQHTIGSSTWTTGSTQTIRWQTNLRPSDPMNIEISRNAAAGPWTTIASNVPNAGSFDWTVTGPPTTRARIRISWANDPAVEDSTHDPIRIR